MQKLPPEVIRAHKGISFVGIATTFLCYDGNGRFLMAKRGKNARDEQGTWEIGAGGLKWGEAAEANMLREIREEYNADSFETTFLGYADVFRELPDGTPTHWLRLDFAVKVDPKQVKNNEPDMIDAIGWFTIDALPEPLHSQQRPFFERYESDLKNILG